MPLSPTQNWTDAFAKAEVEPRFLISIYDGVDTWKATNGICDSLTYDNALYTVDNISSRIDPFTREFEISTLVVTVDTEWLRPIWATDYLRGKDCTIKLGAKELAEGDFIDYYRGPIEELTPNLDEGYTEILIQDSFSVPLKSEVYHRTQCDFPPRVIERILKATPIPDALVDYTSLDVSDAQFDNTGHFAVSTYGAPATPAGDLIQQLNEIMYGNFIITEDGKLTYKVYDSTDASQVNWTSDEIISIEQLETEGTVVNRVIVKFKRGINNTSEYLHDYVLNDTNSQGNLKWPGEARRIISKTFEVNWLDSCDTNFYLRETLSSGGLTIQAWTGMCVSGNVDAGTGSQSNDYKLNASPERKAILKIGKEFIGVTSAAYTGAHTQIIIVDGPAEPDDNPNDTDTGWK